jgi:hypothetical protein
MLVNTTHSFSHNVSNRLNVAIFWDIAPCSLYVNRRFEGMYQLHLQGITISRAKNSVQEVPRQTEQSGVYLATCCMPFSCSVHSYWLLGSLWEKSHHIQLLGGERVDKNRALKYALLPPLPSGNKNTHLVPTLIVAGVQTGRFMQVGFTCRRV